MKKLITLFLAITMCLSLVACSNEASGTEENADIPMEESNENTLYLNETKNIGDYAFTVTGTEFTDVEKLDSGNYSAGDGNVFLIMYFNIQNIGKESVTPRLSCVVEYADGYTFEQTYSMLSMAPLSEAEDNSIAITVSDVIEDDDTSDLKVVIKGSSFGVEEDYTYYLNPMDATQTEKVYQKAKFFVENGFYNEASAYFKRCGDYQDSAAMLSEIAQYQNVISDPGAYKDDLNSYRAVSGSEISELLVNGNYMMSRTGAYWTFNEDGTLYDELCNGNIFMNKYASYGYGAFQPTWRVEGDKLVVVRLDGNGKEVDTFYSVFEVSNGLYLLQTDSTELLVGDVIGGDGTGVYSFYKKGAEEDRFLMP